MPKKELINVKDIREKLDGYDDDTVVVVKDHITGCESEIVEIKDERDEKGIYLVIVYSE